MRYCGQCRIGTFDQQGLCILCGAPAEALTGWRRLASGGASVLAASPSPQLVFACVFAAVVSVYALLLRSGVAAPATGMATHGLRAMLPLNPMSAMAILRADPAGGLLRLLAPALLQGVVFALVLLAVFLISRRRQRSAPKEA